MKLVFVMDGTVPVLAARVIMEDGWGDVEESLSDQLTGYVAVEEVAEPGGLSPVTWVVVDVNENGGLDSVSGATGMLPAIQSVADLCNVPVVEVTTVTEGSHYAATYREGSEDESYAHAFKL